MNRAVGAFAVRDILLLSLVAFATCGMAFAADDDTSAGGDDVKAVFVYKFTSYITWPDDESKAFTVAVLGNSGIVKPLKAIAAKRKVNARPLVIKECTTLDEISGAHMLLISKSMESRLDAILEKAEAEKILTVGDGSDLAKKGVAINFCSVQDRVGFEMNLDALKRSGLVVSSQLVKVATIVEEDKKSDSGRQGK